jgi:hypothetical protein
VETNRFREDGGRLYNAAQEDYSLPADSQEVDVSETFHADNSSKITHSFARFMCTFSVGTAIEHTASRLQSGKSFANAPRNAVDLSTASFDNHRICSDCLLFSFA